MAARRQATRAEARAAEIEASLAPGGEVLRDVADRAERVEAILESRHGAGVVERLAADVTRTRHQADEVERQLAERGLLGRQTVRGVDREALEQRLSDLRAAASEGEDHLAYARDRLAASARAAGPVGEHDAVLEAWHAAGGNHAEVLARTAAARGRGLEAAQAEAQAAHQRAAGLDAATGRIRQELSRRDAQLPAQRLAEDAQRVLAAQQAAQQQHRPGPGQSQGQGHDRGGASR